MKFAPDKCLILSKQKNLGLRIGINQLPEVSEAIYLGIPLNVNIQKKLPAIAPAKLKAL